MYNPLEMLPIQRLLYLSTNKPETPPLTPDSVSFPNSSIFAPVRFSVLILNNPSFDAIKMLPSLSSII